MKINKESFLRIWGDPVWSSIISATILFIIPSIWAYIKSLVSDQSFIPNLSEVLSITIPIRMWHILFFVLVVILVIKFIYPQKHKKNYRFLKENTSQVQFWTWTWSWVLIGSKYDISNIHPLCPYCGGILSYSHRNHNYKCGKMGCEVDRDCVPDDYYVHIQILHDLKDKYPKEAHCIRSF